MNEYRCIVLETVHEDPFTQFGITAPAYDVDICAVGWVTDDGTEEWFLEVHDPTDIDIPEGPFDTLQDVRNLYLSRRTKGVPME